MVQAILQSTEPAVAEGEGSPAPAGWRYHMAFHGTGGGLFGLILKNVLLTLLTLGVYAAWATTARRKYVWQNVEFHGQRLVYHGTGRELFSGYLKLIAGYVVFLAVPALLRRVSPTLGMIVQMAMVVGLLGLVPFAVYWSRAYLLSRTTWRGIRFSMEPGAGPFARTFLVGYVLTILTLGLYGPVWLNRLRKVSIERSRFGSRAFRYDGSDSEVWKISIKGMLLSVLTLGIYYFWYIAELSRYETQHTYFDGARGRLDVSGVDILKLTLLYLFGTTLTLGLAFPWLATYALRFMFERLSFEGPIDFAAIAQVEARGNAAGDGLADVMDLGLPL
jgi:uncharacterized membrane protein YjgN (DUF898 family)